MNFEQIMIKLGVDGSAVKVGLGSVTQTVKAWIPTIRQQIGSIFSGGAGGLANAFKKPFAAMKAQMSLLAHDLLGSMGRMLGGYIAFESIKRGLESIKEQIIEVNRISEETGAGTNFVQSMMLQAKIAGVSLESLMAPIVKFNQLIGKAKMGDVSALEKLDEIGVAHNSGEANALGYEEAMKKLKVAFDHAGSSSKQDAILFDAFGRSSFRMSGIFRQSSEDFNKMFEDSFFTKLSTGTISDFMDMWRGLKVAGQSVMSTIGNIVDLPLKGVRVAAQFVGAISDGARNMTQINQAMQQTDKFEKEQGMQKALANQASEEGVTVEEEKAKILNQQNDLLEKQAELTSEIADRDKMSVNDMASKARQIMGIKSPMERMHTVTPRMREALKIKNLEEKSEIAWLRGDDKGSQKMQSEADRVRKSNPWMMRKDVNPMSKTEIELGRVNMQLEPVKRMAEIVTNTATK